MYYVKWHLRLKVVCLWTSLVRVLQHKHTIPMWYRYCVIFIIAGYRLQLFYFFAHGKLQFVLPFVLSCWKRTTTSRAGILGINMSFDIICCSKFWCWWPIMKTAIFIRYAVTWGDAWGGRIRMLHAIPALHHHNMRKSTHQQRLGNVPQIR